MKRKRDPRRSRRVGSLLDETYAFVESPRDELSEGENDLCRCGVTRGGHEGEGGVIAAGKCRGFREAL
jgi:hypothetical protein